LLVNEIEIGLKHRTVTVLADSEPYEITTYRTEGPYSDSRRPDYEPKNQSGPPGFYHKLHCYGSGRQSM